jgi:type II secretory pathway component PulM
LLQFQKVEFDRLMRSLLALTKTYVVSVGQLSVAAESAPGIVNAELTLSCG